MEGTVIRTGDFGRTEGVVEAAAYDFALAPRPKSGVGPADLEVEIDESEAVRHGRENALRLKQMARGVQDGGVAGIGHNGVEMFFAGFVLS